MRLNTGAQRETPATRLVFWVFAINHVSTMIVYKADDHAEHHRQSHLEIGFRYGHCFKYIIVHLRAPPFPVTGSMLKVYHIDRKKVTGK